MYRAIIIFVTTIASLLSIPSSAQSTAVGMFNSLKGIGLTLEIPRGENDFTTLVSYVEMYGIPTGRCDKPGFKVRCSHDFIFRQYRHDSTAFQLYAGPGVTAGYMRDYEVGRRIDNALTLMRNPGIMAALCGSLGCRFSFEGRIDLDLSVCADIGIHARRAESRYNIDVRLYRNGLLQSFYPELSILFRI